MINNLPERTPTLRSPRLLPVAPVECLIQKHARRERRVAPPGRRERQLWRHRPHPHVRHRAKERPHERHRIRCDPQRAPFAHEIVPKRIQKRALAEARLGRRVRVRMHLRTRRGRRPGVRHARIARAAIDSGVIAIARGEHVQARALDGAKHDASRSGATTAALKKFENE